MKDITDIGDDDLKIKKEQINKIITLFKLNKESLLVDQYNNSELFNKIKNLSISKGGFLDIESRKKLWDYLFYKRKNKKCLIDLVKINEEIKVFISKINIASQKKELTDIKLRNIKEYQIILNDLPRTCKNIITNKINKDGNKINNISPEIILFSSEKFKYQYIQGFLNIVFYFKQLFKYEDCINALNIYFEFFNKDLLDIKLSKETNDENLALISIIITDLFKYIYPQNKNAQIVDYIPILSNKWIISSFLAEIKDINKGFRILDYLITSEPYTKYVLASVLLNKFHDIIITKHILNEKFDSLDNTYEAIFDELKKSDLNSIDFDEIIIETESIINKKGNDIKLFLISKFGNNYKYSFNINNHGLITYYNNLVEILNIKEPKKEFKLYLGNPKYYIYFAVIAFSSMAIYYLFSMIDNSRIFW